ncbi:Predicted dehydrogenase [Paenibacillus sp. yr247]|uniref:Gfo/Idh/MocA family protein n=1 Tax=Paenibacillus sp. yr247 TaxID=1761880 RepID=UPI00088B24ED|nr:Gfo/Idh/MocA family oxidoreductase [Paenibacillus sp. yr247]SDP17750.1 Predicted dehydrogenase [Paenibacillus sp. yr247]
MSTPNKVKIGLIGLGSIGSHHINYLKTMDSIELVGVCDIDRAKADKFAADASTTAYYDYKELFAKSGLKAVIIAVPHYDHTPISEDAFQQGLHVLTEKPLAVHINDAQKSIDAYEDAKLANPNIVFGIMFQERTLPFYAKIKDIVSSGELGRLTRTTWIHTKWFRSQTYYDGGDWRATWAGEGGGILTNQCPHTLDMYQWLVGVPSKISGHAHIGKYRNIEVEDEVTAYFEHENGMIGHLMVTTAESPGTNRLEIIGELGKLVYEDDKLTLYRNRESMLKYGLETKERFGGVENWPTEIPVNTNAPTGHKVVTDLFVKAIQNGGGELIAHGTEGIKGLTIANGIMLSSFKKQIIDVPFSGDEFEAKLKELIASSKYVKKTVEAEEGDFSKSFSG